MWNLLPPEPESAPTLSAAQQRVAEPWPGSTLVWGGPGSGKTSSLVAALAHKLLSGHQLSDHVVLAASRAAAQRIRRAVISASSQTQLSPVVTTVHGFALGLMRRHEPVTDEPWVLLRAPQQEERIRELLSRSRVQWPDELEQALPTGTFARQLRELLARIRQRSWDEHRLAGLARERGDDTLRAVAEFFTEYLNVGDLERALDYAELVYRVRLLVHEPDTASALTANYKGVFVDDAHDLDGTQLALIGDLARAGLPVTVFADEQQVVSGFRGASSDALKELTALPNLRTIELGDSFRHSAAVLASLAGLRARIGGKGARVALRGTREFPGEVTVAVYDDGAAEAAHVADQLRRKVAQGCAWGELAVITRAGRTQLAPLVGELVRLGIPVEVPAQDVLLANDDAVRLLLGCLALAAAEEEPGDDDWAAVLTSQLGGYDVLDLRKLARSDSPGSLWQRSIDPDAGESWADARRLADALLGAREQLGKGLPVQEALWCIWSATDWPERLRKAALAGARRAHHHLDAMVELFHRASLQPLRSGRAGALALIRDVAAEEISADTARELALTGRGVTLTTAHQTKGRQWRHVWVVGVEEGRWPRSAPAGLLIDPDLLLDGARRTVQEHLRDERRLFYLACSRARDSVHVSGTAEAGISRFCADLGVSVQEKPGRPQQPMTAAALVGQLRRVLGDAASSPALRRGAAQRLAHLAEQGVRSADSASWWGLDFGASRLPAGRCELSGSAIEDILTCPRRYFLVRKAGGGPPMNRSASLGTLIHEIVQEMQCGIGLSDAQQLLDQRWGELVIEVPWLARKERAAARGILERAARWLANQPDPFGVEQEFTVELTVGGREVVLRGRADRVDIVERDGVEAVRVVDFKTIKNKPTARELAENVQLGVYQLAAQHGAFGAPGARVAEPTLVLLRHDEDGLPAVCEQSTLAAQPWPRDLEPDEQPSWIHSRIAAAAGILSAGQFPARPGAHCRHCEFRQGCPSTQGA
ncbi:ATP-dependent DNA helicase [Tessaracoccus sp. OH4464_COT-324]|uniref:ATP-dependent DNA helicase n=1 Tax=Tessaracoccus sp. OH4464_COT-324 TaxID=2491059 RepID=UPI001319E702|nr:ATP-dependent DNA helicase [Tessaracoccus sp. OH4464_COT-324]